MLIRIKRKSEKSLEVIAYSDVEFVVVEVGSDRVQIKKEEGKAEVIWLGKGERIGG